MGKKVIVGLIEKVTLYGPKTSFVTLAKFDTGARGNSIDTKLAKKMNLKIVSSTKISSASIPGSFRKRPVVEVEIKVNGKKYKTRANITDRSHLSYPVLIGRNLIHSNFIIDIEKTHTSHNENDLKPTLKKKLSDLLKKIK